MGLENTARENLEEPLAIELDVFEFVEDEVFGVDVGEAFGADESTLGLLVAVDTDDLTVVQVLLVLALSHIMIIV